MKIAFLVPAYNQPTWSSEFLQKMTKVFDQMSEMGHGAALVFVDDGSTARGTKLEDHWPFLSKIGIEVFGLRHSANRGQGAALGTAVEMALSPQVNADLFLTIDADGQHDPMSFFALYSEMRRSGANIVFGNRFGHTGSDKLSEIPFRRRVILFLASLFERAITGLTLTDAHNGLRLFDRSVAEVLELRQDRMAHATEFKQIIARHHFKYSEAAVEISYSPERLKSGQSGWNSVNILRELFQGWLFQ